MNNYEVSKYTDQLQSYALYLIEKLQQRGFRYEDIGKQLKLSRQTLSLYHKDPSKLTIKHLQTLERTLRDIKENL